MTMSFSAKPDSFVCYLAHKRLLLIAGGETGMPQNSLTIIDNRTGTQYEIPVWEGTVRATELRRIKESPQEFGLMTYDPGYANTASCRSAVTYIDGDRGILQYRGYPIEQLTDQSTYLETAFLLIEGELPSRRELDAWAENVKSHTLVHDSVRQIIDQFPYNAHPMGMLASAVAALSTVYPEAKNIFDAECRRQQIVRLIAQVATLAAFGHRRRTGLPYSYPDAGLTYAGNFLNMLFRGTDLNHVPSPVLERALEVLFILHADHEQNCSTSVMRGIGSAHADPYVAAAGAIGALYGPLHGGANEAVLRMLMQVGSQKNIPDFIRKIKSGEGRLMGFGHRVYKSYDPRARRIKAIADEVFGVTGRNPLLDIALELEKIALQDEYFVSRKLYPNVDFYSGLIYQSIGIPVEMFPVMFAVARMSGWLAQWQEQLQDPDLRIARPRQVYVGARNRDYVPVGERLER